MGAPSSGIPTSRTSTNVSAIVSGKSHAPMFDVLHNLTGEKRNASSAFRALRPGAAAISTPARPVSAAADNSDRASSHSVGTTQETNGATIDQASRTASQSTDP